jgi:NhaP-type Na+/H+ or K+/H+ antiporter
VFEMEPYPEDLKDKLREEIRHTTERPLKGWERWLLALFCLACGIGLVAVAIWVVMDFDCFSNKVPVYILIGFTAAVLLLGYTFVYLIRIFRRGTERPRTDDTFIVYAVAGFILYMATAEMFLEESVSTDTLVALIVAAAGVVYSRVQLLEVRLRERILRNELALAKLTEFMADRPAEDHRNSET